MQQKKCIKNLAAMYVFPFELKIAFREKLFFVTMELSSKRKTKTLLSVMHKRAYEPDCSAASY